MKIEKIKINNYRLLREFTLDTEKDLTLIVGKNNTGKTSVLQVLDKFLNAKKFSYDDINNYFKSQIYDSLDSFSETIDLSISLSIFISYNENDNLSNIRYLMQNFDPDNNFVVLNFKYGIGKKELEKLNTDFTEYITERTIENNVKSFNKYLRKHFLSYFKFGINSILYDVDKLDANYQTVKPVDLKQDAIDKIINFKYIDAKRLVSNTKSSVLSNLSYKFYEKKKELSKMHHIKEDGVKVEANDDAKILVELENQVEETDKNLTKLYSRFFVSIIEKAKQFGGIKSGETILEILSELQYESLLSNNITVMYKDQEYDLPENFNGLGYLNLLSIIFEIESLLHDFKSPKNKSYSCSDLNLLFIEEPEAHTHPQMQYIFIKNIKKILNDELNDEEGNTVLSLQTIMTTHSSHIVSGGDFNDIKYFKKNSDCNGSYVISRNLKELEISYKTEKNYMIGDEKCPELECEKIGTNYFKFLKQYLTLNRSDIFFADKVILIEGDTERILIPAMMKKLDLESISTTELDLLSQNISIIEVGAYSHIYEKFLAFIGIRTLIITDIDFGKKEIRKDGKVSIVKANSSETPTHTTNSSIQHFYNFEYLKSKPKPESNQISLTFLKDFWSTPLHFKSREIVLPNCKKNLKREKWVFDKEHGQLLLIWQCEEKNCNEQVYHARSFEDAFIHVNKKFIYDNYKTFTSLAPQKTCDYLKRINYNWEEIDSYVFADEMIINGKPSFAMDILLYSDEDYSNWNIPAYIKEGLLWLKKD